MNKEYGFTLIEIIVSLIIVGIMAAVAGMGLTTGLKGFLFSKENAHMSQKAQIALTRLNRELMELLDVVTPSSSSIIYERTSGNFAIAKVGSTIKIREGSLLPDQDNGDILIDNVNAFTLSYYRGDQAWQFGTDSIQLLSAIKIDFVLTRSDSGVGNITFSTTVHPRNTKNYGGAPPTTTPPSQPSYGCFVSTLHYNPGSWITSIILVFLDLLLLIGSFFSIVLFLCRQDNSNPMDTHVSVSQLNPRGSVIIGLIATMVIFSALGAVMLPLTTASTFNQVSTNTAARAYFLAEAGYRYAASEFLNAADEDAQDAVLVALDDQIFSFADNDGQFHLGIDSYWFKTTADPNGTQYLNTTVSGGLPSVSLDDGYLEIDGTVHEYKNVSINGSIVSFQIQSGNWPSIPVGTRVHHVARSDNQAQTVTEGGNLILRENNKGANAFPLRNGQFIINGSTYDYKTLDLTNNAFLGITDPDDPDMPDFAVPANSWVTLQKFLKIQSTGTFAPGQGTETTRVITYSTPLGWVARAASLGGKTEVADTFEDTSQWKSSYLGSHATTSVEGGNALDVTGADTLPGLTSASLIAFDWANTDANLADIWDAAGNLLSYDVQTKIRVWQERYYMAGLSFRLDSSSNSYGISYLRAAPDNLDGIPDGIVPIAGQPMVVLWQQTSGGTNRKWLAYKTLSTADFILTEDTVITDDMESGGGNWDAESPWALITSDSHSATTCWTDSPGGNYDNNKKKELDLTEIDLSGASQATLSFWHRGITYNSGDKAKVQIRHKVLGWHAWTTIKTYSGDFNTWRQETVDISSYLDDDVIIRFQMDTDGSGTADGWYIDDVTVTTQSVEWPTLLLRIGEKEADSGRFSGQKVNDIQVFIGDVNAHGTPGTNPLDTNRKANPRDQVSWPPDDVADTDATNDSFTLVQWDANVDSSVDRMGTGSELNTIIRSNSLTTPSSGSFAQDEIALHTWGWDSEGIYFDDFAIQIAGSSSSGIGFLNPIQE